ncbi:MAG: selenide, water dikinase SelD [Bacteroidales bacterium]
MEIYLDYNATTPVDPRVAEAMRPYLQSYFGNPSSSHHYGITTKKAVEKARAQIARLLNCQPHEVIFTSGGSESNNYAIKGTAMRLRNKGNHIITSTIEHPAVSEVCRYLEDNGFEVSYIPVDDEGIVKLQTLEAAIKPTTILITIMHANNEIGTLQPLAEIAKVAKKHGIRFHSDAAQSIGKVPTDVQELGVDLLSVAGHKLYAPKGIGALYIREGITLEKLIHGADHEQNKRAGTENVLEIVGLGKAAEIAFQELETHMQHMRSMRDRLEAGIMQALPQIHINGHKELRLPNTSSISFPNIEANTLLSELETAGIAASAGAACHTDNIDLSEVLQAIKLEVKYAMGTIRFSTGRNTTEAEIDQAINLIVNAAQRLMPEAGETTTLPDAKNQIKLTHYTQGLGCACKLRPQALERILKDLPHMANENILVDTQHSDDAAVYKINSDTALVQTLDFFTPIVDDAYHFGAIAAANALSDIYAMGATPLFALNIVGFPSNRLPEQVLRDILQGAADKAKEAEIPILGGHTIDDPEPKYGMVVSGTAHPSKLTTNDKARVNDVLILTKPIGTGILTTALKRGLLEKDTEQRVIANMSMLNKEAASLMMQYGAHACTDITGFGLIGHMHEVMKASGVNASLWLHSIPIYAEAKALASANVIPGGSLNNQEYFATHTDWEEAISAIDQLLMNDAQTSGGLLIAISEDQADALLAALKKNHPNAAVIGRITEKGTGRVRVEKE